MPPVGLLLSSDDEKAGQMTNANGRPRRSVGYVEAWDRCAPPNPGGSLGVWTWEIAQHLADNCDVVVCGPRLDGAPAREESEGVRFIRLPSADDRLFTIARRISDAITRRISNPQRPAFASPNYLRVYVTRAVQTLRFSNCGVIHIFNHSQFVPVMRRANPRSRIVLHMECDWLERLDRAALRSSAAGC